MRKLTTTLLALSFILAPAAALAKAKTYQFTGQITAQDKGTLTVKKDAKETWEFDLGEVKAAAGLKVGDKITVKYRMQATDIEKK